MEPQWKTVPGFNERYEVSDAGQLRSTITGRVRNLSLETKPNGYLCFTFQVDNVRTKRYIHRVVWEAFSGTIPEGLEVNHKNGIRADNRLCNLELLTRSENMLHGLRVMGRELNPAQGSRHGMAVLTEADIPEIRKLLATSGLTNQEIGARYGVSKSAITAISRRATWRHI